MTPERAREILKHIEFVKALADGKTIQYMDGEDWRDIDSPCFDSAYSYRIKPKSYRPFTPEEMIGLVGAKIANSNGHEFKVKLVYTNENGTFATLSDGLASATLSADELLNRYTFPGTGNPCGGLVSE